MKYIKNGKQNTSKNTKSRYEVSRLSDNTIVPVVFEPLSCLYASVILTHVKRNSVLFLTAINDIRIVHLQPDIIADAAILSFGVTLLVFGVLPSSDDCCNMSSEKLLVVSRPETWLLPVPLRFPLVAFLNFLNEPALSVNTLTALGHPRRTDAARDLPQLRHPPPALRFVSAVVRPAQGTTSPNKKTARGTDCFL